MKKIILSITAILSLTIGAKAQAPDFNFETWAPISPPIVNTENPVGWASLNALTVVGTAQSVFKETATPAAGSISAKITTIKVVGASIPNPSRPGKNVDTAGILSIGKTQLTTPYLINGNNTFVAFPRPSTLSFQCKYTPAPVGADSAFVIAILTKWNGTKRDTIAVGKYATGGTTTSYSLNSLTMIYNPAFSTVMPDSEQVFISSSIYSHSGAQIGSAFYIDALAWSGYTSVNEIAGVENNVSVFPNPANDQINFNSTVDASLIQITDITGRLISSYKMMNNKTTVQTTGFTPGVYLYNLLNDKKEVINRGKFEVTK